MNIWLYSEEHKGPDPQSLKMARGALFLLDKILKLGQDESV